MLEPFEADETLCGHTWCVRSQYTGFAVKREHLGVFSRCSTFHHFAPMCVDIHDNEGPFMNSVTRYAALFRRRFTLTFPRVSARHAVFTAVRLFSVYFGLASRPIFDVRDCVTLESFLRFTPPPPLVTRDAICVRPPTKTREARRRSA